MKQCVRETERKTIRQVRTEYGRIVAATKKTSKCVVVLKSTHGVKKKRFVITSGMKKNSKKTFTVLIGPFELLRLHHLMEDCRKLLRFSRLVNRNFLISTNNRLVISDCVNK